MPARIVRTKHAWTAVLAIGLVAAGSSAVADAYPCAGFQWAQNGSSVYADATGGTAVPAQNPLFGDIPPTGNYGAVATPVVDTQNLCNAGILAHPTPMPMAMPSGRMAPAPRTAAIAGQTAGAQDEQSTSPFQLSEPIVPVGAQ
jgi:hypothetical protein